MTTNEIIAQLESNLSYRLDLKRDNPQFLDVLENDRDIEAFREAIHAVCTLARVEEALTNLRDTWDKDGDDWQKGHWLGLNSALLVIEKEKENESNA